MIKRMIKQVRQLDEPSKVEDYEKGPDPGPFVDDPGTG